MKYLAGLIIVVGSLAISPVFADYPSESPKVGLNTFYFSGDTGFTILSTPYENLPDAPQVISSTFTTIGWGVGATIGYRRTINPWLSIGAETGYDYNGTARYRQSYANKELIGYDELSYKVTSQDNHFLGVTRVTFHNGFIIFGKAGAARVQQELKVDYREAETSQLTILDENTAIGYKPMAAAGIGFTYKILDIYAQYSHIFGANVTDFSELVNSDGTMTIVSVDTVKFGLGLNIKV
jgi:hypothetical protein